MNALRRVEVYLIDFGDNVLEVCAEADCNDEELLAFGNAEHGGDWVDVIRGEGSAFKPVLCLHDPRRMHFVLVREEPDGCC